MKRNASMTAYKANEHRGEHTLAEGVVVHVGWVPVLNPFGMEEGWYPHYAPNPTTISAPGDHVFRGPYASSRSALVAAIKALYFFKALYYIDAIAALQKLDYTDLGAAEILKEENR